MVVVPSGGENTSDFNRWSGVVHACTVLRGANRIMFRTLYGSIKMLSDSARNNKK